MTQKKSFWKLIIFFAVTIAILTTACNSNSSSELKVEIFYLPHPPAEAVVQNVEKVISQFKEVELEKYDFMDSDSQELVDKYKLEGHIPVAIFINGKDTFWVSERRVIFRNFPKGNSFTPAGFSGNWNYDDLRQIIKKQLGNKEK